MRKQIAAANWKMNMTYQQAEKLLDEILDEQLMPQPHQEVIFAVPYPYLLLTRSEVAEEYHYFVSAQNCHHKTSGAYTGEISAEMLQSLGITYCVIGHSERREYNQESGEMLAAKLNQCISHEITPIFCCGEPLAIREAGTQNEYVAEQLKASLYHLDAETVSKIIIAYEPVWAIGTGKTASTAQAQEMHLHLRTVLAAQFGQEAADEIPILYGGSVKASNAKELFACPDVDGGLVGGASLNSAEFVEIIKALK